MYVVKLYNVYKYLSKYISAPQTKQKLTTNITSSERLTMIDSTNFEFRCVKKKTHMMNQHQRTE